ncbi:MAG: imidazole glycerol phosphate synthase subunit HisF [Gammaproteobacteria bacterium]|nr:imidazole glycerol phosphate synthase subunit HisF [Gammaproteobacteria bacterium]
MVGWTELQSTRWPNKHVYFVNSYAVETSEHSIADAFYGVKFCAAIQSGNFTGVQFHPEKSGDVGIEIIRQVLNRDTNKSQATAVEHNNTLLPRIIVCLDVDKGRVVKGTNFKELRDMGDPVELAMAYEEQGADELVFLDISASNENRPTALKRVTAIAEHLSIPFTVGGGLRELDDVKAFLDAGADKVALNTTAIQKPDIINQTAKAYGSQCVVVAIDVDRDGESLPIYIHGGRTLVPNDFFEWTREVADRGAGEILLTAMHRDGTGIGFDTELTRRVSEQVGIQVIASGGAKTEQHFLDAFNDKADACLAAGMFHSGNYRVEQVKEFLTNNGIAVR